MTIAVIKTGGKQYLVQKGAKLKVEKLNVQDGQEIKLETLLRAEGAKVEIGQPKLATSAEAKILISGKAKKIMVVKYKAKTRYNRRIGHRQQYSQIEITKI